MTSAGIELKLWSDSIQLSDSETPLSFPPGAVVTSNTGGPSGSGNWVASLPLLMVASVASSLLVGIWEPSLRFQPSIVGMLWAGTFLSGYLAGSLGRGKLWGAVLAVSVGWSTQAAFEQLTDFGTADSILLAAILLLAGWATSVFDPVASPPRILPLADRSNSLPSRTPTNERWRWSIWEIGFVTAIVACIAHAWPRLDAPPELLWAVLAALLAGSIVSWLACRWIWKDDWSLLSLAGIAFMLAASMVVLLLSAPPGQSMGQWLTWLLCGPVNVAAAQGVCVLATLGVWRQCQPNPPGLPAI